jgi:hypothetical protein
MSAKPVTASREAIPITRSPSVRRGADRPADVPAVDAEVAGTMTSPITAHPLLVDQVAPTGTVPVADESSSVAVGPPLFVTMAAKPLPGVIA